MIWYLILIPLLIYIGLVLWFVKGWVGIRKLEIGNLEKHENLKYKVSVIIPCRNESENIHKILGAIDNQNFDFKNLEVIVVDDHSTDNLKDEVFNFQFSNFKPLFLTLAENETGKKAAISKAIEVSNGEIIVCTDADCLFENEWLKTMSNCFDNSEIQMATGPVMFFERRGFWNQLMQLEFLSLIGIGAASVQNGFPNMCNGANIAYRRSAFFAVNGFEGNQHIPSGDDEFLMHKISQKFRDAISFIKDYNAVVYTVPPNSLNEFISQRIRWGSKAGHYKSVSSKLIPGFMWLFNSLLFFTPLLFFAGMPWTFIATLWLGKLFVEIVFFAAVLPFFRSSKILDIVIPAQVFHVAYITIIGILSLLVPYRWKGRKAT